jgi:hypothetical protein
MKERSIGEASTGTGLQVSFCLEALTTQQEAFPVDC